ncbi:baseplate J/gp47 family protein [Modicisalibacter sp. MOD 31.J]|uniref:baseplate assembly protein n=1 Tax=Modicisalibacter sp. MOD 31.J TaxID=2831897 RepID=UPI001CCCDFD5|nr:baseplate J/gp47 family protein [Modicisalibacter sp. MOD 31.J]MBZ9576727.1 baseplate J/gp47 family protein [Modicisalibacter sp. MOD 31.J]
MTTPIDLSRLPLPAVVENIDFEAILADRQARLLELYPADERAAVADLLALESEPLTKYLQENAYREMVLRQRINEAAAAGMLAANFGADLDGVAGRYETQRLAGESDERLRERTQLAFYQVAAAGPAERYRRVALDAHPDVVQVDAWQERPGVVRIALLTRQTVNQADVTLEQLAIGRALFSQPSNQALATIVGPATGTAVSAAKQRLQAEDVQPVGVDLRVGVADILAYRIEATLVVPRGPDPQRLLAAARTQLDAYLKATAFRVDIHRPALQAALLPDGARTVELIAPADTLARGAGQIAVCTQIDLRVEVRDD